MLVLSATDPLRAEAPVAKRERVDQRRLAGRRVADESDVADGGRRRTSRRDLAPGILEAPGGRAPGWSPSPVPVVPGNGTRRGSPRARSTRPARASRRPARAGRRARRSGDAASLVRQREEPSRPLAARPGRLRSRIRGRPARTRSRRCRRRSRRAGSWPCPRLVLPDATGSYWPCPTTCTARRGTWQSSTRKCSTAIARAERELAVGRELRLLDRVGVGVALDQVLARCGYSRRQRPGDLPAARPCPCRTGRRGPTRT